MVIYGNNFLSGGWATESISISPALSAPHELLASSSRQARTLRGPGPLSDGHVERHRADTADRGCRIRHRFSTSAPRARQRSLYWRVRPSKVTSNCSPFKLRFCAPVGTPPSRPARLRRGRRPGLRREAVQHASTPSRSATGRTRAGVGAAHDVLTARVSPPTANPGTSSSAKTTLSGSWACSRPRRPHPCTFPPVKTTRSVADATLPSISLLAPVRRRSVAVNE